MSVHVDDWWMDICVYFVDFHRLYDRCEYLVDVDLHGWSCCLITALSCT